jgi:hypothetical protein
LSRRKPISGGAAIKIFSKYQRERASSYSAIIRKELGKKPRNKFLVYGKGDAIIMKSSLFPTLLWKVNHSPDLSFHFLVQEKAYICKH